MCSDLFQQAKFIIYSENHQGLINDLGCHKANWLQLFLCTYLERTAPNSTASPFHVGTARIALLKVSKTTKEFQRDLEQKVVLKVYKKRKPGVANWSETEGLGCSPAAFCKVGKETESWNNNNFFFCWIAQGFRNLAAEPQVGSSNPHWFLFDKGCAWWSTGSLPTLPF